MLVEFRPYYVHATDEVGHPMVGHLISQGHLTRHNMDRMEDSPVDEEQPYLDTTPKTPATAM